MGLFCINFLYMNKIFIQNCLNLDSLDYGMAKIKMKNAYLDSELIR
jgi:hypothetical protein